MTDGIIQKVFSKWNNTPYLNNLSNRKILQQLQQELVAEIRKEFQKQNKPFGCGFIPLIKLIGDNQE